MVDMKYNIHRSVFINVQWPENKNLFVTLILAFFNANNDDYYLLVHRRRGRIVY